MATGKAKENTVSTKQTDHHFITQARKINTQKFPSGKTTFAKSFYTGPFVPPESFVIPSNHTADDLLKRAVSQR